MLVAVRTRRVNDAQKTSGGGLSSNSFGSNDLDRHHDDGGVAVAAAAAAANRRCRSWGNKATHNSFMSSSWSLGV
ncbi:hypothetical protein ElyMa_003997300 [Elysia marginata]|uniref:Uncharacterized protein n=1 Tax=Elysia marginata TaxID=1093978 RepID=A0AAV4G0M8_9GAST|nr:hypothetical protein ElyMa_003997300 [Elysia marginata]